MIIKDEQIKVIDKKIEDMSKGLKKGFWAGLLAFVFAKITHLLITFALGLWLFLMIGDGKTLLIIVNIVDNPILGLIYLVFVTRWIYILITKE
jgi:hypothetical protein